MGAGTGTLAYSSVVEPANYSTTEAMTKRGLKYSWTNDIVIGLR